MRFAVLCSLLLFFAGCSEPATPGSGDWKPVADVPQELLTVAQKKLPQVKFDTARKITVRGKEVFEIRGKQANGKVREVEVATDGEIVEVEQRAGRVHWVPDAYWQWPTTT